MGFDTILMALGTGNPVTAAPLQQGNASLDDYQIFDRLRREGRSLQDVLKQADEAEMLRKRVDELSSRQGADEEVFPVMEQAVSDDPNVVSARESLARERTRVISGLLLADEGFRKAHENYRHTVQRAYVSRNAQSKGQESVDSTTERAESNLAPETLM